MPNPSGRRYDEKETRKILRRAGEIQSATVGGSSDGVSLDELQRAAAAAGFDPELIAQAAAEIDNSSEGGSWTGSKGRVHLERSIEGEPTEDTWLQMVTRLRKTFGKPGEVGRLGTSYEWSLENDNGTVHFSAIPRDGRTALRLSTEFGQGLWIAWVIGMSMGLVLSLVAGKFATAALGLGVGFAAFFATWLCIAFLIRQACATWDAQHLKICEIALRDVAIDQPSGPQIPATSVTPQEPAAIDLQA